jgi:hypothetical protein
MNKLYLIPLIDIVITIAFIILGFLVYPDASASYWWFAGWIFIFVSMACFLEVREKILEQKGK